MKSLSGVDEKTMSNVILNLNSQAQPLLQFSEESKYYFELNNSELTIKKQYIESTEAEPKIYRDNINFPNANICSFNGI